MDTPLNMQPATPEIIWAMLRDLTEKQAETRRNIDEVWKQMKDTDEKMKETTERMKETDERIKATDRQIKATNKQLGGMAYNQGRFAEEYFFNAFEKGERNFFGEKFDDIKNNIKGTDTNDEFDIVMVNGQSVGIVEIKYKAHENDVAEVLGKANAFRVNFPRYKGHAIYLGLASMAFYPELEQICRDRGIAIIKQMGDVVVINDAHLKAF